MPGRGENITGLGPLESEVMELVWEAAGPLTVRDVVERLNARRSAQLAYTTVMTVMNRLVGKDVLGRTRAGRGYAYESTVSDPAALAVRNVMRDHGDAAIAHFVEEAKGDPRALRRLQRLLEES